jgi:Flagellar hook-length control protein FliK
MKTPDTAKLPPPPAIIKDGLPEAQTAGGLELQQRLWQLLFPLTLTAAESPATGAINTASTGLSPSPGERDSHSDSGSGELVTTAYLLAGQILQFTLQTAEAGDAPDFAHEQAGAVAPNVSVRLDAAHRDGGVASIDVAHPELGDISLEVELAHGALRVIATANSELSAQVLLDGQALLAARMLRQGVTLERLDVIVRKRESKQSARRQRGRPRKQES